jgi:TP901 family phage tail tape measure protein
MAREYTVKINVQSEKAAKQIEQFSAKALANIEKINKVEIKPKTTTKDVEVSLNRVQEASMKAATAETNRAAATERAAASVARAHATEVNALEKTKQAELKLEAETTKANAKLELQKLRMEQSQNAMHSFANATQNAVNQLKMLVGYAGATQMLRSALTEMKAMSDELVTYQKVTGATAKQMEQVRASAYQSAKQYGQAPSDYLESVARMARAGYGQQAEAMANLATKTQLVGDMSAEMASKFLIAVDAGYRLNGNIAELEKVLNAANVADNNYATSLAEIAEGMTLIAPLAAGMNVSVQETTAAIGTMQALTQRSGTEVARAFRMIAINIAKDTETEVEEGFKLTQENVEDFNALLQEFAKDELKAADAAGKLLNPMKAIGALAKAWKSGALNEQQLFNVLNSIGGARYTNNIMALVKNFDVYEEMLGKFSTELTSADDEVNAMMDSWTRKLEVLKTSWVEMVNNRLPEGTIKSLLDFGTWFLNTTGNLENFIGVAGGAIVVIKQLWTLFMNGPAAMNPVMLAVGAVATAFGIAKTAIDNHKKAIQENSNAAAESASKAYEQAKSINELVAAYNALAADGTIDDTELDEAKRIQEEINKLVEDLPEKYNLVTGSIQGNKKALAELNEQQRQASITTAKTAVNEAKKAITDYAQSFDLGNLTYGLLGTAFEYKDGIFKDTKQRQEAMDFLLPQLEGTLFSYKDVAGGGVGNILYKGGSGLSDILKGIEQLEKIRDEATEYFSGRDEMPSFYNAILEELALWDALVENLRSTEANLKDLENADYSRSTGVSGNGANTGNGTGTGTNNDNKEAIYANDAYAKSYDRLKAAIDAATTAQEKFNDETSTTKGDQLKFYGSALESYNEELKAGRVNSNAFHAAAKALMGEDAYNATGGYTQNVQAAMNATGSAGISLLDAITTLTAEYKNQADQVREGAGLAVLLEKLGYNVKDSQGNYVVKMTEDMYKEVLAAIPGLTREMLENAANAYDQYDKNGINTNIAPEEIKSAEEQNTDALNESTTAIQENTAALNELKAQILADREAAEKKAAEGQAASPKKAGFDESKQAELDAQHAAEQAAEAVARAEYERAQKEKEIAKEYEEQIKKEKAYNIGKRLLETARNRQETIKNVEEALGVSEEEAVERIQSGNVIPTSSDAGNVARATPTPAPTPAPNTVASSSQGSGKGGSSLVGEKPSVIRAQGNTTYHPGRDHSGIGETQDEKKAADQERQDVHDIASSLNGEIDKHLTVIADQQTKANKQKIEQIRNDIARNDVRSAFGENAEWANKYRAAYKSGDQEQVKSVLDAYLQAEGLTVGANVDWKNNEATFNDVVIGIEPILDKYSMETVVQSLDSLSEERREAVIAAMLEKYSLAEVMSGLQYATDESRTAIIAAMLEKYTLAEVMAELENATDKDRVAVIKAAVEKYGVDAVAKELSNLTAQKRTAYINTLVSQKEYQLAADLLAKLPKEQRTAYINTLVDSKKYNEAAQLLNKLPKEQRIAYISTLIKSGDLESVRKIFNSLTSEERKAWIGAAVKSGDITTAQTLFKNLTSQERVAYIKSAIANGEYNNVKTLLNGLSAQERIATIKAAVASGDYKTALDMLGALTKKGTKTVATQTESTSYNKTKNELNALTGTRTASIFTQVDPHALQNTVQTIQNWVSSFTATVYTQTSGSTSTNKNSGGTGKNTVSLYDTGTESHPGGMAYVNDGTGAELILDSSGAHVANGGKEALVNLERGAKVYTAEQTRRLMGSIPHFAVGNLNQNSTYEAGGGGNSRVQQFVNEINDYFDSIHTGDTSYTQSGGKSGSGSGGSNTSTGRITSGGGSASAEDQRWESLKSLIEYILKRLNKALTEQERVIDLQIQELQERRKQSEEQSKLESLQKAVTDAQADLLEAQSNRTVRYLNENGQWEWMADQRKVVQAKEALTNAQESLQDYLNDLVIDAQIQALENEKTRLSDEYQGYADMWSDILDAVDTPDGDLVALISSLTASGTGAQKNGAAAVRDRLVKAMQGGSYKANYGEAIGEIAKAAANNPSVPGITDAALAAMIASSGTNVSQSAMYDALQSIAGGGTLAGGKGSDSTVSHQDTYYMINGVQIGSDMAELPMSDVLRRLSVFTNTIA